MREYLIGAVAALLLVAVLGQVAPSPGQRYVIIDSGPEPPILLNTDTGMSWVQQWYDGDEPRNYPAVWTPVQFKPMDSTKADFDPGSSVR